MRWLRQRLRLALGGILVLSICDVHTWRLPLLTSFLSICADAAVPARYRRGWCGKMPIITTYLPNKDYEIVPSP